MGCMLPKNSGRRVVGMRGQAPGICLAASGSGPSPEEGASGVFLLALQMGEFPVEREAGKVGNAP